MLVPRCDICGQLVAEDSETVFQERVAGGVTWIAHERCLQNCPKCGAEIEHYNCVLRQDESGYNGYLPAHRKCSTALAGM